MKLANSNHIFSSQRAITVWSRGQPVLRFCRQHGIGDKSLETFIVQPISWSSVSHSIIKHDSNTSMLTPTEAGLNHDTGFTRILAGFGHLGTYPKNPLGFWVGPSQKKTHVSKLPSMIYFYFFFRFFGEKMEMLMCMHRENSFLVHMVHQQEGMFWW
jgi:hypothetical protein